MVTSDPNHQTDEHGFAPTRIVRVRHSRRGGRTRFFRVWMKPEDLAFPGQERELVGAELIEAMVKFAQKRGTQGDEVRLAAGTLPGVYPKNGSHPNPPVGDSGSESAPRVCAPFFPHLIESRGEEVRKHGCLLPTATLCPAALTDTLEHQAENLKKIGAHPKPPLDLMEHLVELARHGDCPQCGSDQVTRPPQDDDTMDAKCDACGHCFGPVAPPSLAPTCLHCGSKDLSDLGPEQHLFPRYKCRSCGKLTEEIKLLPAKQFAPAPAGGGSSADCASPAEPCLGVGATLAKVTPWNGRVTLQRAIALGELPLFDRLCHEIGAAGHPERWDVTRDEWMALQGEFERVRKRHGIRTHALTGGCVLGTLLRIVRAELELDDWENETDTGATNNGPVKPSP